MFLSEPAAGADRLWGLAVLLVFCLAFTGRVVLADGQPAEIPPRPQPTDTSQLMTFTEALMPHAAEVSSQLASAAQDRQGRRLQQVCNSSACETQCV